jgi:UDP-N-acetylmuramoyl-L-alanyl-D-glutamate--2,6-diaminopimelate ligase
MMQKIKNYTWHPLINALFAVLNRFPAHQMVIIGVTGTKGKSSVVEMLYEIFNAAGYKTAILSGIHFAYPGYDAPNLFKMTMPGRGFVQRFLGRARNNGATHAIVEITSEATLQFRHRLLSLDGLVVTIIQKEHIEAHGSFENYVAAKREIVRELERSKKRPRVLVVNETNPYTKKFLEADVEVKKTFLGAETPGAFTAANERAALAFAAAYGIDEVTAREAIRSMPQIKGRLEPVVCGQPFSVIVDYAHTPDSLIALYEHFPDTRKICVLGNTGGGRDTWKRPEMGRIADDYCDTVILTDEDPYDEDPEKIINEMRAGMKRAPRIIRDRRDAIRAALTLAKPGDTVLISGKGTDPYIMGPRGTKVPWSDVRVAEEELRSLQENTV